MADDAARGFFCPRLEDVVWPLFKKCFSGSAASRQSAAVDLWDLTGREMAKDYPGRMYSVRYHRRDLMPTVDVVDAARTVMPQVEEENWLDYVASVVERMGALCQKHQESQMGGGQSSSLSSSSAMWVIPNAGGSLCVYKSASVEGLVEVVRSGDPADKAEAADVMHDLLCCGDYSEAIREAGASDAVAALLETGDAAGKAAAIRTLALLDGKKTTLVLGAAAALLGCGEPRCEAAAANALARLAWHRANADAIVRADLVAPLVKLLLKKDQSVLAGAIRALYELVRPDHETTVVDLIMLEDGALGCLIGHCRDDDLYYVNAEFEEVVDCVGRLHRRQVAQQLGVPDAAAEHVTDRDICRMVGTRIVGWQPPMDWEAALQSANKME